MARLPFPENTITGVYGSMSAYRKQHGLQPHSGTDFAPAGSSKGTTPIPAVAAGTIKIAKWSNVLGWNVVQTVWDASKKKAFYVGYSHLKCNKCGINCKGGHDASLALNVKVGQKVKEGDTIAIMGNTGSASSGVHLHLTASWKETGIYGVTTDKFDYVEWFKAQAAPAAKTGAIEAGAKPATTSATKVVYACPHCKKELK